MNEYRTNYCHELRIEDVGKEVRLAGWVQTLRDLGSMMFVDLRDHFGITQLAIEDEKKSRTNEKGYYRKYSFYYR